MIPEKSATKIASTPVIYFILGLILAAAAGLYIYLASLHEPIVDEAVYNRAARKILNGDWLLEKTRANKPFMIYYLLALERYLFGATPLAGRIHGILATLTIIIILFRITHRFFGARPALITAFLIAFSPFVLQHFPRGTTDSLALALVLGAAACALGNKIGLAGLLFALAFCTRQMAVWSLPLILAFAWLAGRRDAPHPSPNRQLLSIVRRLACGMLVPLGLLILWSMRQHPPFTWAFGEMSQSKYHTGRHLLLPFIAKLRFWIETSYSFFAATPLTLAALLMTPVSCLLLLAAWRKRKWAVEKDFPLALLAVVECFILYFYTLHSVWFFTMYPRFLMPVLPWLVMSFAANLSWLERIPGSLFPPLTRPLAAAFYALLGGLTIYGATAFIIDYRRPAPEDDVPRAVQWIVQYGAPRAMLITEHNQAELANAASDTGLRYADYDRQPFMLNKLLQDAAKQPTYLYLDQNEIPHHLGVIRLLRAKHLFLSPVADKIMCAGRLYLISRKDEQQTE